MKKHLGYIELILIVLFILVVSQIIAKIVFKEETCLFSNRKYSFALPGKIIGTSGCYQHDGTHEYTNVFDGKVWTSFICHVRIGCLLLDKN